jgi:hypothetical protein
MKSKQAWTVTEFGLMRFLSVGNFSSQPFRLEGGDSKQIF